MSKTKKSLVLSCLSMLLCVSMLIGSTFAWFTDSASTGVNKIQAGNLAIDLIHVKNGENISIKEHPDHLIFDYDKWEPGYTAVETLRIVNKGNLALQFRLDALADGATAGPAGEKLADVIDVYVYVGNDVPTTTSVADMTEENGWYKGPSLSLVLAAPDGMSYGLLLPPGATSKEGELVGSVQMTYALHMQESAGNAYQGLSLGDLRFTLRATQYEYESDSFNNTYDENATYPAVDQTELSTLLNGGKVVTLAKDIAPTETITVSGNVKSTLDLNGKKLANDADIWSDGTINWSLVSARNGADLTITGNGTFAAKENDCFPVDVQDGSTVTIKNGTFIGNIDAVYVLEGTAIIEGGFYSVQQKFPTAGKENEFVLNCLDANYKNGTAKIIVTGGTFVNFNPADCWAEGEHTNFVAAGYKVVPESQTNGDVWYTVVPQ